MVAPGLPWAAGPGPLWEADGPQWEVVPHLRAAAVLAAAPGVADLAAAPVGALAEVPGVEASVEAGVEALAAAPAAHKNCLKIFHFPLAFPFRTCYNFTVV